MSARRDVSAPHALFETHIRTSFNNRCDVAKVGRFLIPVQQDAASAQPINVIVSWPELLKK